MSISTVLKLSMATVGSAFVALGIGGAAQAAIMNGDFKTGDFTGWQTIGNTTVNGEQASLSATGVYDVSLETFLGLNLGTLDALGNGDATVGSAIKQTITVKAGDILSFDWLFKANDYLPFNDSSFFSISSSAYELADVLLVGDYGQTASQTSYTFQTAGTYTVGFGVVNALDAGLSSNLSVDNVTIQSVPEPASVLGLLAFGALGTGSMLKRKQQQQA